MLRKAGYIALLLVVLGGVTKVIFFRSSDTAVEEVDRPVYTLSSTAYQDALVLSGTVAAKQEVTLKAEVGGVVRHIAATAGTKVSAGDTLVELDADDDSVAYSAATNQISALQSLYDAQASATDRRIDILKDSIDIAQSQYDTLLLQQKNLDTQIASQQQEAEAAATAADTAREEAITQKDIILTRLYNQAEDAVRGAYIATADALNTANKVVKVDSSYDIYEYAFDDYFAAQDSSKKRTVEQSLRVVNNSYEEFQAAYDDMRISGASYTRDQWDALLTTTEQLLLDTQDMLKDLRLALDETPILSAEVETVKSTVVSHGTSVQAALLDSEGNGARGLKLEMAQTHDSYDSKIREAQAHAAAARERVSTVEASGETERESLRGELAVMKEKLAQAKQSLSLGEHEQTGALAEISAQIRQLDGMAQNAALRIGDAVAKAPFQGVVTKEFVELGDMIMPGMPLITVADDSQREVLVQVADTQVARLQIGMDVLIRNNDGRTATGTINVIHPAVETGSYTVPVEISLPEQYDEQFVIGSVVEVTLPSAQKETEEDNITEIETFRVPKQFVGVRKTGPIVEASSGQVYDVHIVDDRGDTYVIEGETLKEGIPLVYPSL